MKLSVKKTITLIVLPALIIILPITTKSQNCQLCAGTPISNEEFERYKQNYKDVFIHGDPAKRNKHPEWIYLPKTYINFFSLYLKAVNNADGIWIFLVNNRLKIDNNQQKDLDQIMFNISGSENCSPEYSRFNSCLAAATEIKTQENKIHISTRKNTTSKSIIDYTHIMGKTSEKILQNSFRYVETYKEEKYSLRMHLSREHISQLKTAIEGSGGAWNGIKLYFGVYGKIITCTRMKDPNQITLIALPVRNQNNDGNMDDYNSFLKNKAFIRVEDVYNHGALCPQVCN
ncbi:MAG: hypothetical protein JNM14_04335 [Ferruginibacter sp.]|nr:hypothetical protein [Ferruginibacter sp.]